LLPLYLRNGLSGEGRSGKEKVVYTIHNLAFQGIFNGDVYSYTNLPFFCFSVDTLEYYGNINCLKGGVNAADVVTTVSHTYAKEIRTAEWGCGLHGVFGNLGPRLVGIVNGIDLNVWNPATDKMIAAHFNREDVSGKTACKADLIRRMKLSIQPGDPLIGMVTRLTSQKGIDLIDQTMPEIMAETTAGMVILGSGSSEYLAMISGWMKQWPGRVVVKTGFDVKLAHRIEAGCDIYLMPSKFEPCGLNQLYSLRYGAIPVVHAVGGLADTIIDVDDHPSTGYGFSFANFDSKTLVGKIKSATACFRQPKRWAEMQQRAMRQDFGWINSAKAYGDLYTKLVASV
jgi:starch synthase